MINILKYDYYIHASRGYYEDYFGCIGSPVKVHIWTYYLCKSLKYRVTKVSKGSSMCEVIEQAIQNHWMSNDSFAADKLREQYCYSEDTGPTRR